MPGGYGGGFTQSDFDARGALEAKGYSFKSKTTPLGPSAPMGMINLNQRPFPEEAYSARMFDPISGRFLNVWEGGGPPVGNNPKGLPEALRRHGGNYFQNPGPFKNYSPPGWDWNTPQVEPDPQGAHPWVNEKVWNDL